jgi:AcrR family transcriptional regulator
MSPRTEKQNKAIRKKVESKILEAALELFASEGYDGTSMQMIALKSDVSKGNLYNYFNSKQDLLEGVLISGLNKISNSYNNYANKLISEDEFEYLIRGNFKIIGKNRNFWRLYFNLVAQPKVQELFKKVFSPFLEQYFAVFELYYKNRGDKDPNISALLLGSTLDGISLGYIVMGDLYPLDEVLNQLINKFK